MWLITPHKPFSITSSPNVSDLQHNVMCSVSSATSCFSTNTSLDLDLGGFTVSAQTKHFILFFCLCGTMFLFACFWYNPAALPELIRKSFDDIKLLKAIHEPLVETQPKCKLKIRTVEQTKWILQSAGGNAIIVRAEQFMEIKSKASGGSAPSRHSRR